MIRAASCVFAILGLSACAQAVDPKPTRAPVAIDVGDLSQHWVHSSEEERSGESVEVYRPAASRTFPPSRFRMAYKFAPGGGCELYFLSPDDAHRFEPCEWSIGPGDEPILRVTADGTTTSFRIVELSMNVLRLVRVRAAP